MSKWAYFGRLFRRSWHGTLRFLEIGEAFVALTVHVSGYFLPEYKEELEMAFVVLLVLFFLTFFFGLFTAAYAFHRDTVGSSVAQELALEKRNCEIQEFAVEKERELQKRIRVLEQSKANELEELRTQCVNKMNALQAELDRQRNSDPVRSAIRFEIGKRSRSSKRLKNRHRMVNRCLPWISFR